MRLHALDGLEKINRFSRTAAVLWSEIQRLGAQTPGRPLRVLDVGSGGGDVAVEIARRASSAGLPLRVDGCDISVAAVQLAAGRARAEKLENVRFFVCGALADSIEAEYDVVMCSLFLHHFSEHEALQLLTRLRSLARQVVLVDDLRRTALGYGMAWLGCRMLTRSPIVHSDGPISVAAAFTPAEARALAERAGLVDVRVQLHWPQRFLLVGRPAK
jgi:2-polyprenyl-3-methyl-5-hydroxy-6-metoxy-1,4-benzoquinol methylase